MDVKGSAARGRRMFLSVRNRLANAAALALLAIIGLGWSGQSHAQSCDFVQLGAPSAISLAGTSVSFTLEAQTACSPTVDVTLVVTADTTGGATVAAPANPTVNLDTPYVFTVNLGATPGGTGTVVATCQSGGCTGDQLVYTFATNNNFVFTAVAPAVVTNQITPFTLTTNFQLNGAPGALNTSFFNVTTSAPIGAAVAPDAAGSASITSSIAIANTYNITGSINCPALFLLEGCPPPPANFTVLVEPVSVTPTTPLAPATPSGTPLNMAVGFGSASIPAPDGTNINWSVTAQPAGGDGAVAGNAVAGGGGQSTAVFTATVPGTYTVVANSGCTFCAPGLRAFTVTVTAVPYVLVPVTANPLSGTAGVGIPVTVRLEQGGLPVAGATIEWSSNVPFSPSNINSVSNGLGEASATFTPSAPGNFTNAVVAFVDIDGIPASGDEATFIYDANIALGASLAITGGNSQNASPGAAFAGPLQVNALNSGVPAPGVTINWAVTSGSAVLSAPTSVTDAAGNAAIGVTAGATAGPVTITGTRQDDATATVTFNLTVSALPYVLVPVSANPLSGTAGVGIPVTVRLEQGGVPVGGATVQWSASAPFAPANTSSVTNAAAGEASATFTPSTFGSFTNAITASVDIDGIPASGDEATFTYDANIAFVASLAITGGNSQNASPGAAFAGPLQVNALNSGVPAPGVTINWAVTSGSAVLSAPTSVTDAAGNAAIGVTAGATAGPVTITGTRQDDATATVTFNLTVSALPYVLVPVSANPLSGTAGVGIPVTVRLEQGGVPVGGATVQWSASAPFAPANTSSVTNAAAGEASATFTPSTFGSFTNAITASVDIDGIPASGDEATFTYDANIAFVASLAITGGNSQNALVNAAFAGPLQVNALNSGVAAPGVTINWAVTSGSAVLSAPTSVTDAAGNAAIGVTAGATAGPATITGTRQDAPSATATFTLSVDALGSLAVIGGDGQLLASGVASAPLQVKLTNAAGLPVAGAVVAWTTSTGTLASASSTTNATGVASNTVITTTAGAVQVSASSPLATAPAVFALNGALASLGGLTGTQREVAQAIDAACPALANLGTLSAGQQDLLARCRELIVAAGIDPTATIAALDQLMADVALTQANAAFSAAQSQFINLKTRIAALRSGTGGTDFGGLAINTSMGPVSLGTLAGAFSNSAAEAGTEVGTDFSRWGFFAAGTVGRGEAEAGSVNPAYDFDVEGITAGVDYRKSDKWIIGGSFGYTRQDTQLPDDRGGLDTTGWSLSAYTTFYQADSWYLDGVLTYGRNDYELLRQISYTLPLAGGGTTSINQVAQSDAGGDLLSTAFTVGRDWNFGAFGVGPYARALYTRLGFDDIDEELVPGLPGSGLGLRIENRDVTSLASVLGAKFTYTHSTGWGVLMPHLQLEWEHEFEDDPQAIEARFINDPTGSAMLVRGDPLDTNYFRLGFGLSMVLTRGRSGFFYYERLTGMNGMSQDNLALGFRMEF
jgi:uncharacterized protein YhjY with autotransporter beta-barrel domain